MSKASGKKNDSKPINQVNMEKLEVMFSAFIPVDQIWKTFKQSSFDLAKTTEELTKLHAPNTLPEQTTPIEKEPEKTEAEDEKKKKFKTSEEVYNRLKWSGKYNTEEFTIGYEDRFVGIIESPLDTFSFRDV